MKKIFSILLFVTNVIWAQDAFELANKNYRQENYKAAISGYEKILNEGKESAELYFNLGNCYYKLHRVGPAVYNYEKALMLNPNDEEIQTNLDFARKMAIDDIKIIPKVGFHKIIADFTSAYHYNTWAWIAVGLAFLFLLCFFGYYFSFTTFKKRIFFSTMFLVLVGIALSVAAGIFEKNRWESEKPAIVFAEIVPVKSEPKLNSPDAFVLHEGTKVYVLERIANWKKIELTDETTGWIEEHAIKEIKN